MSCKVSPHIISPLINISHHLSSVQRKSTNWLREKTSTSGDLSAKPRTGRYVDPRGGRRPPRMARTMNRGKYAMDQEREGYTPVPRSAIPRTIQEEEQAMRAISPRSRTAAKRVPRKR